MAVLGEVLVAVPVMLAVLGSVFGLYHLSVRQLDRGESRAQALAQQREGLRRMTRELRQATKVVSGVSWTPGTYLLLRFDTYVKPSGGGPAVERRVQYLCAGACSRWESDDGGASWSDSTTLVTDVANLDAFDVEPDEVDPETLRPVFDNVNYVKVKLDVNITNSLQGGSNPANPIVLSDAVRLRNVAPPLPEGCPDPCDPGI